MCHKNVVPFINELWIKRAGEQKKWAKQSVCPEPSESKALMIRARYDEKSTLNVFRAPMKCGLTCARGPEQCDATRWEHTSEWTGECIVVLLNQLGREYFAIRSSAHSFARTAHSFARTAHSFVRTKPLALLVRPHAVLPFARPLAPEPLGWCPIF